MTAGIAWHGHRPGRKRGIWRVALDRVHRPSRSSAMLCGQSTSCERGRVRGSDQLQQVACGACPTALPSIRGPAGEGGSGWARKPVVWALGVAVCFLFASKPGPFWPRPRRVLGFLVAWWIEKWLQYPSRVRPEPGGLPAPDARFSFLFACGKPEVQGHQIQRTPGNMTAGGSRAPRSS